MLACAICPACLSLYAKVFATLGVGFALTETHHALLLAIAVGVSLLFSAARSLRGWRVRARTPNPWASRWRTTAPPWFPVAPATTIGPGRSIILKAYRSERRARHLPTLRRRPSRG